MDEPHIPLPQAPILSYVSNISTPTRVRRLAAGFVLVLAILLGLGAAVFMAMGLWDFVDYGGVRLSPADILDWIAEDGLGFIVLVVLLLIPTVILLVASGPIRRGRKVPAILALLCILPLILVTVLMTAGFSSAILAEVLHTAGRRRPLMAFWLVLFPAGVLVVLLLKDLCAILLWIARNPLAEKPRVPFLPVTPESPPKESRR